MSLADIPYGREFHWSWSSEALGTVVSGYRGLTPFDMETTDAHLMNAQFQGTASMQAAARYRFFRALDRVAPEVLADLRGAILRGYQQRGRALQATDWWQAYGDAKLEPDVVAQHRFIEWLWWAVNQERDRNAWSYLAVTEWTRRWNLTAEWVDLFAGTYLVSFRGWALPGHVDGVLGLYPSAQAAFTLRYDPFKTTRKAYRQRCLEEFKRGLDAFLTAVEERAAATEGVSAVASKRARIGGRGTHFEWLALHVCLGHTVEQIAEAYDVDARAVSRAVSKTRKLVGLPSRGRKLSRKTRAVKRT